MIQGRHCLLPSCGLKEDDTINHPPDTRKALFAAITKRKVDNDEESDDDSQETGVQYSSGVQRLQKFLIHSKSILSIADDDLDSAIRACKVSYSGVNACASYL